MPKFYNYTGKDITVKLDNEFIHVQPNSYIIAPIKEYMNLLSEGLSISDRFKNYKTSIKSKLTRLTKANLFNIYELLCKTTLPSSMKKNDIIDNIINYIISSDNMWFSVETLNKIIEIGAYNETS